MSRVQESPFRETEWDQRLDRMLDDLKSTVTSDGESGSPQLHHIRSSSRSESRGSNRGSSVEDGGRLKHHHREYNSPDNRSKLIADQYEYDSGDVAKPGQYQKKIMKSTYTNYNVSGNLTNELDSLRQGPDRLTFNNSSITADEFKAANTTNTKVVNASQNVAHTLVDALSSIGSGNTLLTNGQYDDQVDFDDSKSGDVRRIVWRNRFEKTYEANDSSDVPTVSIEEDSRHRKISSSTQPQYSSTSSSSVPHDHHLVHNNNYSSSITSTTSSTNKALSTINNTAPDLPQVSPGAQSWADPIPLPTPPQVSPRGEPGVAYVYTYGQGGGSQVQHLPPLNYVNIPGATSIPPSEGAPSPTPSTLQSTQPIIYHYSYHYTIQPGQSLPDGVPQPPISASSGTSQPQSALQLSTNQQPPVNSALGQPGSSVTNNYYSSNLNSTSNKLINRSEKTTKTTTTRQNERFPRCDGPVISQGPCGPGCPVGREGPGGPSVECGPNCPGRLGSHFVPKTPQEPKVNDPNKNAGQPGSNISITINKTTTQHTTSDGNPFTSTPYPNRNRSRSPSPERKNFTTDPNDPSILYITRTSYSDSLERMRRPTHEGLPFPETSPIKPGEGHIPRRVDDLMCDFPNSEDGRRHHGPYDPLEKDPLLIADGRGKIDATDLGGPTDHSLYKSDSKKDHSKNLAGPPVYYPPGHQLFSETMHTMTLKDKKRGTAKWRMEKSAGYKESSSSSESKGGMAVVPVCLPLCCGAACVVM